MSEALGHRWERRPGPTAMAAAAGYLLLVAGCTYVIADSFRDLASRRDLVAEAQSQLAALNERRASKPAAEAGAYGLEPGSTFMGGDKLAVAAADLQKRVASAVSASGGTVLSSQIERQEPKGPVTGISLALDCEIDQAALSGLLYNLESQAPFLFVDGMDVRTRSETGAGEPRLRVGLKLSAFWRYVAP